MRPLKIALLSRWYFEENRRTGGAGTVQQLAEAVASLGHEVVVLSQSSSVTRLEKSHLGALEVWLSPRDQRRGGWAGLRDRWEKRRYGHRKVVSDALDLRDFLAARGPFDVLWAQCEEPDGLVAAIAACRGVKLPPTLTQIYALRYRFEQGRPVFTGQAALGAAFSQAERILAASEMVRTELEAYAGPHLPAKELRRKTHVVPHNLQQKFLAAALPAAVDGSSVEPRPDGMGPSPHAAPPEPGRVLFLGALNEKKGALVFLEAMPQVRASGGSFAVAGDFTEKNPGFARDWKAGLARIGPPVELLGQVPAADLVAEIRRARVVVLPSLFDEFSRALVEALVLGCPVVTTDAVGAAPFVQASGAGLVVPAGDAAALARAIEAVLDDRAAYAGNAQALAPRLAQELSPQAIALQIARHLSEISG